MLIKKILLKNIRSYEEQEINFNEGSTLLSGDIGSGKTSILLGIEFALFGLQPGQRGNSLLRNGKKQGGVEIGFEVGEKNIVIERSLKRGKNVSQDYCAITIDGTKEEMSVTELKNKVLELLNYPQEFSKKQNILYKFTVYTPQEEMKQIILQDPDSRINTLRHVFGIDKYKKILENVSILTLKIREEKRMKEGLTANLEQSKSDLVSKEDELEARYYNLSSIEKELFQKIENRKKIQEEKEQLSEKIEEKNKLQQEIEKTKIMISNKRDAVYNNNKLLGQLKEQIQSLQNLNFDESKIVSSEKDLENFKEQKEKINEENIKINSEIASLNLKNEDNKKLEQKLSNLEICPTCLQNVDAIYRANVLNRIHSDLSENNKTIKEKNEKAEVLKEKIKKIEQEIQKKEKELQELNILKIKIQNLEEKNKRLKEIENSNLTLEKDINFLNQHMESLKNSVFQLNKYDNLFEAKKKELDEALKQERSADIKVAELKKEIEFFLKQIEDLKTKIAETEKIKKQLDYLVALENWLSKKFISLISFIEKNVMIRLRNEFSNLFSEWFSMLVSDSFVISLDDNFTPIVEQQDYEIDYSYLSGGEKTAIALAYRLALNQVINSFLSKIKTKDLVILDEPTDGFSDTQLDKMRDVLQQLNVKQLIIVSHEQKIEGFVENVIKFRKEKGISQKVQVK